MRGDAWQRTGHVGNPTIYTDGLSADVRGTWHQVERVTVQADAKGIHTNCTCGAGEYCRHAAALLLHWVRAPQSFADLAPEMYGDPPSLEEVLSLASEPPDEEPERSELASLLETYTMTELREIARRRGVHGGGRNKIDLAATLAVSLADPENIDTALATLTDDERTVLQLIDLLDIDAQVGTIRASAQRVLSEGSDLADVYPAIATLVNLGLVFNIGDWRYQGERYTVPQVVAARIPLPGSPLSQLIHRAERADQTVARAEHSGLDLMELFLVVVHEVLRGSIGKELPVMPAGATIVPSSAWMVEPPTGSGTKAQIGRSKGAELTLRPQPPYLSEADLQSLSQRTGESVDLIDFAVTILIVLDILTMSGRGKSTRLVPQPQRLRALLQLPPADRALMLVDGWLSLFEAFDFRSIQIEGEPLELHTLQLPYHAPLARGAPHSGAVRNLMAKLLVRLTAVEPEARWYDLPAWLDMLWTLTPDLLGTGTVPTGEWWFSRPSDCKTHLDLQERTGWQEIWEPLLESMLLGPLTWLHLVDTSRQEDGILSFRPRPEAALGFAASSGEVVPHALPPLVLQIDHSSGAPEILVPAGYPDLSLHSLLAEMTDLADVSPVGLRYRLTRQRAQEAFDRGETAPDLLALLTERIGGSVPEEVRAVLDTWWTSYGQVRLYDDLTLIELDDDILLQVLLATSSLRTALVEVITPRLVAIDPAAIRPLMGEMERLGYTPRIVEGV